MGVGLFLRSAPLSQSPLGQWIAQHRPELDKELAGLPLVKALAVLNRETGLQVPGTALIENSLPLFLNAFKKQSEHESIHDTDDK